MSTPTPPPYQAAPRAEGIPTLRLGLGVITVLGLSTSAVCGIVAIFSGPLSDTATKLAVSGVVVGFYGLLALGATTLHIRSARSQFVPIVGVLTSTCGAAVSLVTLWNGHVSQDLARVASGAVVVAVILALSGFLLSHQRVEDWLATRFVMYGTLACGWALAASLVIDLISAAASSSDGAISSGSAQSVTSTGAVDIRFVGLVGLLTLLGIFILPALRRANPGYRI